MSKFDELKEKIYNQLDVSDIKDKEQKVQQIILISSGLSAGAAVQPLPFADFPILTTIEAAMVMKIGDVYGFKFSLDRSGDILKELAGVIGLGWLAKNAIITGYKTIIPFAGGFFTIPLVFGACYGIGKVADYYFKCKVNNVPFDESFAKKLFKKSKEEGTKIGKNDGKIKEL